MGDGQGPQVPGRVSSAPAQLHPKDPSDGLITQQGVLHPSVTRAEPQTLGRSQHHQRLVGWEGLAGPSLHRVPPVPPPGAACRTRPEPARAPRGQVRSLQCPLPPLKRVPGHAWGSRARPAHSQDTAVGLGPALRSPASACPAQFPFLCPCHTVETGALTSLLGQSWPGGEAGRAKGQPPLTCHRDTSNLFILVKKRTKRTLHCIWLDP